MYSRFFALLTLVVTSGCKTGYCSPCIFISFVKLTVVINITDQSNVRSRNGSCASDSLTLVFLNFLRFYCLPRSLEGLYVSFPVLLKLFRGQLVVIHTEIDLFRKYHNTLCCSSNILVLALFSISLGTKAYCLLIHWLASFVIDLSSFDQVGIFFSECV